MVVIVALKVFGNSSLLSSLGRLLLIFFPLINGQCLLILCMFTHILSGTFYLPQTWLPSPQSLCGQRWILHLQTSHHDSGTRNTKGRGWTKGAFPEALPNDFS